MDEALRLQPRHILHGHYGITILYDPKQLAVFRDAYAWLVEATTKRLENGY